MNVRALAAIALFAVSLPAWSEQDGEGCKDTNFSRMAHFYLRECSDKDFDSFTFGEFQAECPQTAVEGHIVTNNYDLEENGKAPSSLAVLRNYEAAADKGGWQRVCENKDGGEALWKRTKNGKEEWSELDYNGGSGYRLVFAQKGEVQITATTADDMFEALNSAGHIALQINFDTGKATIKDDSNAIVDQMVALLKGHGDLKVRIEGHTDNVGDAKANKALSDARAKAVVAALVKAGVAANRLKAAGFGQEKPVADNATEEGRARNRRVELVKQ